jgi:hypothetical protein
MLCHFRAGQYSPAMAVDVFTVEMLLPQLIM